MKAETAIQDQKKTTQIVVNPHLDKIFAGRILFPEKLAEAKEFLAKHPFPDKFSKKKS